jgi:hypothetical protein
MYNLPHSSLWIAISVSTVTIGPIAPAFANPQPLSSVISSQPTSQAPIRSISSTPLDAVLANVRSNPSLSTPVKRGKNRQTVTRSKRVDNIDRSSRGISHLIDTDRNTNVSPVNRLID